MAVTVRALQETGGEERLKWWVLRRFRKTVNDGAGVTFCGSVPQPSWIKRRPEKLGRWWLKGGMRRITSDEDEAERRRRSRASASDDWWNSSAWYVMF